MLAAFYFFIVLMELIGESMVELAENPVLVFIVKPLMMPALAIYFYRSIREFEIRPVHRMIFAALFFSWAGDVFLMVTWTGDKLFLYGLSAFLVAHLFYIAAFNKVNKRVVPSLIRVKPYAVFPILLYFAGLIYAMYMYGNSEFREMQVPVIIYAMVIMTMVLFALNRKNRVSESSHNLVFFGALFFMFSDSLIAVNKFTQTFENGPLVTSVLIMSTYCLGQYLIVKGSIRQYDRHD